VVCTAHPESNKFQIIVADAVVTPPPTQVVCFRKAGRPTSFLSEGFKTAGRFHCLFAGLERFLRQMCTAPGCCRPNRWRYVKAVPWWNGRESRSHAAQSFRASTQPFDFRTSINRARNVSPTQQYPSSFHPSKYLCPSALTAEDTESYSHRKTWSPIKLTRCSHSGLWIALSERASILLPAHPKPLVCIKSRAFSPLVRSTYQYIAIHHWSTLSLVYLHVQIVRI